MSEATANSGHAAGANNGKAAVDSSRRTWLITSCAMGGVGAAAVAVPFVSSFQPSERARAAGAAVQVDVSNIAPGEKIVVEWRGKPVWVFRRTPEQLASLEQIEGQLADPNSERTAYPTPEYAKNRHRSIKPEILVTVGICTHLGGHSERGARDYTPRLMTDALHALVAQMRARGVAGPIDGLALSLGCSPGDKLTPGPQPSLPDDWKGGFLCACHGSTFDVAGRVFSNKPAPDNLEIPPHYYASDTMLVVGEEKQG